MHPASKRRPAPPGRIRARADALLLLVQRQPAPHLAPDCRSRWGLPPSPASVPSTSLWASLSMAPPIPLRCASSAPPRQARSQAGNRSPLPGWPTTPADNQAQAGRRNSRPAAHSDRPTCPFVSTQFPVLSATRSSRLFLKTPILS